MAIILKCSKCKEQLEVDDAFAGGICRCVHCGALSQVPLQPTQLDRKGRPTVPPQMAKPVIATPQEQERLVIAPARQYVAMQKRRGLMAMLMMVAALGMAAAFAMLAYRYFHSDETGPGEGQAGTRQSTNVFAPRQGPHFARLDLGEGPVAYLLDAGSGMQPVFDGAGQAVGLSVGTLDQMKYAVILWPQEAFMGEAPEAIRAFPESGLAGPADRGRLGDWLKETAASSRRDPAPAVEEALARGARTLLLITAGDLDAEQAKAVSAKLAGKDVRLLAAVIGSSAGAFAELSGLVGLDHLQVVTEEDLMVGLRKAAESPGGPAEP